MGSDGLPVFESGKSLSSQLTETKLNALVDYIRSSRPITGFQTVAIKTSAGTIVDVIRQRTVVGAYDKPYEVGSLGYASSTAGPGGVSGPWGGSADTPLPGYDMWKDEWNRERAPRNISNADTSGCKIQILTRIATGGQNYVYARQFTFDCRGYLVKWEKEELIYQL